MQFLLGALVTVGFLLCLIGAYEIGKRQRKPASKERDDTEKQKAERLRQSFQQLMSYDVSKAVGKKVK